MCEQCNTPNLSGFQGDNPKTYKSKKPKQGLKPGKRTMAWKNGLPKLKEIFAEHGIIECEIKFEGCLKNNYLGFAHITRRGNYSEEELSSPEVVVLACQQCHFTVDSEMPKKESEALLALIVKNRGW